MSKTEILKESIFLELNDSSDSFVSVKYWLVKQWIKRELRKISDENELIDEIGDAIYELCKIAHGLGLY